MMKIAEEMKKTGWVALIALLAAHSAAATPITTKKSYHYEEGEFFQKHCVEGKNFNVHTRAGLTAQTFTNFICAGLLLATTTDPAELERLQGIILNSVDPNIQWRDKLVLNHPEAALHTSFTGLPGLFTWLANTPKAATQDVYDVKSITINSMGENDNTASVLVREVVGVHAICDNVTTSMGTYETYAFMNWQVSAQGKIEKYWGAYHNTQGIIDLFNKRHQFIVNAEGLEGKTCLKFE